MKNLYFLFFFLPLTNCISQTNDHVVFDYDHAGNQVKRYLIDIDPGKHQTTPVKNMKDIVKTDLIKADIYDDIKYFPNPVKEELYLQWSLLNNNKVLSISLYTLSGQLIRKVNDLEKSSTYTFSFQEVPQAIYNLVLSYSNGENKTLKIVKH